MPWVNSELCNGCEKCVEECSAGAITMEEGMASIDDDKCIRCAVCHDLCPEDAVRHDGERIPEEVQSNIAWVRKMLAHAYYADDRTKQKQLVGRLKHFFTKNKKVAEKTVEQLGVMIDTEYPD